ncbi:MAG: hypothetical protein Q8Q26_02510 [Pseudorhodobacter sp.]|nr:hypothetical protein [Pseudorhodobacter sp.]
MIQIMFCRVGAKNLHRRHAISWSFPDHSGTRVANPRGHIAAAPREAKALWGRNIAKFSAVFNLLLPYGCANIKALWLIDPPGMPRHSKTRLDPGAGWAASMVDRCLTCRP